MLKLPKQGVEGVGSASVVVIRAGQHLRSTGVNPSYLSPMYRRYVELVLKCEINAQVPDRAETGPLLGPRLLVKTARLQFKLRRINGVFLIDSAKRSERKLFVEDDDGDDPLR